MRKFAFLCHPLDFDQLASVDPALGRKSPRLVRQVMAQVPPSHVRTLALYSPTGAEALCELICIWLLPDQFKSLDPKLIEVKLSESFALAGKLGCELVGLGAYTKVAGRADPEFYRRFPFAVTTGNTYTAALAVDALERLQEQRQLVREKTELTVLGAAGAIGNAVLRAMAPRVARVNLVGKNLPNLERAAAAIGAFGAEVTICADAKSACREADLIFCATSEPSLLIEARDLALNAAVVDVSKPVNILPDNNRPDVTIVDCAMVATCERRTIHQHVRCFPFVNGLDTPEVFACFAESMILALEGRMEGYSQGRRLELAKFPEIRALARKHGFGPKLEVLTCSPSSPDESASSRRLTGIA
jgi:predicted amino acid dehydrogenase